MTTDISNAIGIEGWMSEPELLWLAKRAREHKVIVEVGSYLGRSTRALAENTDGTVYALDDWLGPRDVPDANPDTIWHRFLDNVSTAEGLNVVPVRCDHASPPKLPKTPDMIFIDGSHEYADVHRDIAYWKSRLTPKGLLCGHDYNWPGVRQAVDELLPGADYVSGTSIWLWTEGVAPKVVDHGKTLKLMDLEELKLQGCARDGSADKPLATVLWTLTGAVPRTVTVAICIPSSGRYCPPEWGIALALLQCPPNTNQVYLTIKGAKRDQARNELVEQALSYNTRYVLFLDDDNPPPPDTLYKLLQVMDSSDDDVAVCAGIYGTKTNPSAPLVFQGESVGSFWKWKKGDVFECERIATGCMMIRASAFARIPNPWFVDIESTEQAREHNLLSPVSNPPYYQMTDDIYFCRKVREAGMRILAHGGVLPGHWDEHGNVYFLPDDSYPMVPR